MTFLVLLIFCLSGLGTLRCESADDKDDQQLQNNCKEMLQGCQCFDYDILMGIQCKNVSDFAKFSQILTDGSLFEVNTTYELTLQGLSTVPRGALRGLIVFRLFLDDPMIEEVKDGIFEGVLRLRRFHVRLSSLKTFPDFRVLRNSLRNVNLENSLLTSLEGEGLQDLPLMKSLSFVNNSIRSVQPEVFKGTSNVIIFDISYNELTFLPPNIFDEWKDLKKVVLSHNRLLHVDGLFVTTHPEFIFLDWNQLTDLDSILHPAMLRLETLQLSHNPIEKVTNSSFNGKVKNARFLYMDHCRIREFDVRHYADLDILAILDLSYNQIEEVTNQTIGFGYNIELDFTGNNIRDFNVELPYNVRQVYLSENELTSLGRTLQFSQMTTVSMAENRIQELTVEDLRGVHGVRVLDLQGNEIRRVDRNTFSLIRKDLGYLDLSRNHIRTLNGSIRYLSLLTALNLTDNQIEVFEIGEFAGLNELTELYLHGNQIWSLGDQLQDLPQLQYLVISNNNIQTLREEQIPTKLKYLYFSGNPFRCDCELFPFLVYLNSSSNSPGTDVPLCSPIDDPDRSTMECPEPCTCTCRNDHADHFLAIDCSNREMQNLPEIFLSEMTNKTTISIHLTKTPISNTIFSKSSLFVLRDSVGSLDLTNNSIKDLGGEMVRISPDLREIRLSGNELSGEEVTHQLYSLTRLRRVTLGGGNPWKCDCNALPFRKWILSKSDMVLDINDTRCSTYNPESPDLSNRIIWTLTDLDLCPTDIGLYVSLAFGLLSFCLVVAALKIVWTRYETNVKVWLYSKGVTWVKERDIDKDKEFDAFLSFSHKDELFVIQQIIKAIEMKEPNIRLCLHYKHFLPGEFIHENILNAVQNSKRTVLILTRNFLESEWCLMEFRAAHVQALKDRVHRIVVIKVGDLPKEIDPAIQLYLDSTTYLTWGEKYFWNNLLYILPTSGRRINTNHMRCPPYPQISLVPVA